MRSSAPARLRPKALLELGLFVLAACSLTVFAARISPHKYLWCDEIFSWTLVTDHSLTHMVSALARGADSAPPLYYLIGWEWTRVFGQHELALRSISLCGFVTALAFLWLTLRAVYGTWPAAVAALSTFATSDLILDHVVEARCYGIETALVAATLYLYVRAAGRETDSRRQFVAIAITNAALVYSSSSIGT